MMFFTLIESIFVYLGLNLFWTSKELLLHTFPQSMKKNTVSFLCIISLLKMQKLMHSENVKYQMPWLKCEC